MYQMCHKCSSSGSVWGRNYNWIISLFFLFSQKNSLLDPGASWLYIVSQNASGLYIWRVRIKLPWYLSHQGLARRFYTKVWAVWTLFMVISLLIQPVSGCSAFNAEGMTALSFLFLLFLVQCQVTLFHP